MTDSVPRPVETMSVGAMCLSVHPFYHNFFNVLILDKLLDISLPCILSIQYNDKEPNQWIYFEE